jgi:adenylate cyclase
MATEIERKFLVVGNGWRDQVRSASHIRQGYLSREGRASVRVRVVDEARACLTIKAAKSRIARHEFEYEIPIADGLALLEFCSGHLIDKVRHRVEIGGRQWEVDVFEDENAGLIIAEIELKAESDALELPSWVGREITEEGRYYNAALARVPFSRWP